MILLLRALNLGGAVLLLGALALYVGRLYDALIDGIQSEMFVAAVPFAALCIFGIGLYLFDRFLANKSPSKGDLARRAIGHERSWDSRWNVDWRIMFLLLCMVIIAATVALALS